METTSETASVEPPLWQRLIIGRRPKRTLIRATILAAVTLAVFKCVLLPVRIKGVSMEPTYHDGKVNLINRLAYCWNKPQRGDVVGVKTSGFHIMYLKRIVGLPSETVAISKGLVLINGKALEEPYVRDRQLWEEPARKLEADEYYLVGDNRGMPQEQHEKGVASADHIVGRVFW